ncbi:hypothetical protein EON83_04475 [bacterium]|nr:MAG: hypothetical protein EON83_04475 [bacterium]
MPLPDLCIAPHEAGELASGEPLCAPAMFQFRMWQNWRLQTYTVREVEAQNKLTCFAIQNRRPNSPTLFSVPGLPQHDQSGGNSTKDNADDARWIKRNFHQIHWRRLIYFDDELKLNAQAENWKFCLEYLKPLGPFWRRGKRELYGTTGFKFSDSSWHFTTPSSQLESLIRRELSNPDSDCAFALRWTQLSEQERSELNFPVQNGTRELCDLLLNSIIWSDPQLDHALEWEWSIGLETKARLQAGFWSSKETDLENQNVSHPLSHRQARLLELVVHHCGLQICESVGKYTPISNWRDYGDGDYLSMKVSIPTQHERLEARLRLRDWLQDKVAPEEIPFLLGESA